MKHGRRKQLIVLVLTVWTFVASAAGFKKTARGTQIQDLAQVAPLVIQCLKCDDSKTRYDGARALRELGVGGSSISYLIEALADTEEVQDGHSVADVVMEALVEAGQPSLPSLLAGLKNAKAPIRKRCMLSLARLASRYEIPSWPNQIVDLIDDDSLELKLIAMQVVGHVGAKGRVAVPKLIEIIKDPKSKREIVNEASACLSGIGSDAKIALPQLLERLKGELPDAPYALVRVIGVLGANNEEALQVLVDAFGSKNILVSRTAARALGKLQADRAVSLFIDVLRLNPSDDLSFDIIVALGDLKGKSCAAVPILVHKLESKKTDPDIQLAIIITLGNIGPGARDAIPVLRKVTERRFEGYVKEALKRIMCDS